MIRHAQALDAQAITAIWNPYIRETTVTFTTEEKTTQGVAQMIADRLAAGWAFLVAEAPGVVGFATYGPFRAGPGYARSFEHTVLLDPAARGKGLGRALMAGLLAHASAAGAHVMIGGISSENPEAAAFHAALGFAETACLPEVGYKFGRYLDLRIFQKILP